MTEQVLAIAKNLEMLRTTHGILTHMMNEQIARKSSIGYCEARTIQSVLVLVKERWHKESKKLPSSILPNVAATDFGHTSFEIPDEYLKQLPEALRQSTWFKTCFPGFVAAPK